MIKHTENNTTQYTKMHISRPLSGTQNEGLEAGLGLVGNGSGDWMKEKNKMKNNIKGGFEQNNDGSVISSLVFIWDKNK